MARFELDGNEVMIADRVIPLVREVEIHTAYGEVPVVKLNLVSWPVNARLENPDIWVRADIQTIQQACSVLLTTYRNDADFHKAIIDSIADVAADYGLSERIADRLFDMETVYADCKD